MGIFLTSLFLPKKQVEPDLISTIPNDHLTLILSFLDPVSLAKISRSSKKMYTAATQECLPNAVALKEKGMIPVKNRDDLPFMAGIVAFKSGEGIKFAYMHEVLDLAYNEWVVQVNRVLNAHEQGYHAGYLTYSDYQLKEEPLLVRSATSAEVQEIHQGIQDGKLKFEVDASDDNLKAQLNAVMTQRIAKNSWWERVKARVRFELDMQ